MMETLKLLSQLRASKVELWLDGERLRCKAPVGALSHKLRKQLTESKQEIITVLRQTQAPEHRPFAPPEATQAEAPLQRSSRQEPISPSQRRLWILEQLRTDNTASHQLTVFRLKGLLNVRALCKAVNIQLQRYEILRTAFQEEGGKPWQIIYTETHLDIAQVDTRGLEQAEALEALKRLIHLERNRAFKLNEAPLLHVTLLQESNFEHQLMITLHRLVADAHSLELFFKQLSESYTALSQGLSVAMEPLQTQYTEHVMRARLWHQAHQTSINWWVEQLKDSDRVVALPHDYPRPKQLTFEGAHYPFTIEAEEYAQYRKYCQSRAETKTAVLLTVFQIMLFRLSNQRDVLVGCDLDERNTNGEAGQIGPFKNWQVIRARFQAQNGHIPSFKQMLAQVTASLEGARNAINVPYELLLEKLQLGRDLSRNSLFQVGFALNKTPRFKLELQGCTAALVELGSTVTELDLRLEIIDEGSLSGVFTYNTKLFKQSTIARMTEHYRNILTVACESPERSLLDISPLSQKQRTEILETWNQTEKGYPTANLHQLFERHAAKNPEHRALSMADKDLSYGQLNQRANQLAHHLLSIGVAREMPVALFMKRSLERVACLLAILKTGGAYLPLDPDYPGESLQFILQDSGAKYLLGQAHLETVQGNHKVKAVYIDAHWGRFEEYRHENPQQNNEPKQLAYFTYIIGPTGKHKGVQTTHHSICNRLQWLQDSYHLEPEDRLLQKTPIAYDISVWEHFWPLTAGANLVLAPVGAHRDPEALVQLVADENITHLHFVPSMLNDFLKQQRVSSCTSLKKTFSSGEELSDKLQRKYFKSFPKAELHIFYGHPEITIGAICWAADKAEEKQAFTIGRPIPNVTLYVMDEYFRVAPVGVEGRLLIGGAGLAQGYHNHPRLNAHKFIPDPFSKQPGARLFKTDDLVRYQSDGNLDFVGHLEHHKKIRGIRIDYNEIKAVLQDHPMVADALVVTHTNDSKNRLTAYVIANREEPTSEELRTALRKILPNYMIPTQYKMIDHFPRTSDGKIECSALPQPIEPQPEKEPYARAHCEIEKEILRIWHQVLGQDNIGVHQDFFDIGGDSLGLASVYKKLPQLLKKDLTVMDLFKHPTIHDLARHFEECEEKLALHSKGVDHRNKVKEAMEAAKLSKELDIAIIGMAGRFPGADNPLTLWHNICEGAFSLTTFSANELIKAGVEPLLLEDPHYVPIRGILTGIEDFDADFFGFTPREAQITDPQHRLFLECAWEALENAGYVPQKYDGSIGIYGGTGFSEYFAEHIGPNPQIWERVGSMPILIGNLTDNLCTRVAYKLGLTGPALTVQTACSTSLVAVHLACQGLSTGDCELALTGGVYLGQLHKCGYLYEEGMTLPADGKARSFDEKANGATISQGAAMVVLKRLENAIRDGDRIYAVIKGTAINNDGDRKQGYTSYSVAGQTKAISDAQKQAKICPTTITYMETSSTASKLGDPIEFESMAQAFRTNSSGASLVNEYKANKRGYCAIGALKPNIGGLDVAAGVASLIKTCMALFHRKLPPLIHFETANPKLDMANSPFYVNSYLSEWQTNGMPLRAGVSAFGLGGTNAHLVLEEGPRFEPSPQARTWQIVTLSAKTSVALENMTRDFVYYLENHARESFADMCYTLHLGREDYKYRRALVVQRLHDAVLELKKEGSDRTYFAIHKVENRPVAFMFPGQGAQYLNMGRQLYREELIYRKAVDRCWDIVHQNFPGDYEGLSGKGLGGNHKLDRTMITQPLLFVTEYALAQLLMHWGIKPEAMIGNSLGEYTAACLAGVFSLEDCLIAIVTRGRLMQEMPEGAQLAVSLPENQVCELLNENLSLAGVPHPKMCMISGEKKAIHTLKTQLEAQAIDCHRLHADQAFHSYMMDPVVPEFTKELEKLTLNPPKIRFISNVTGTWITDEEATSPSYWARQLREPVRFSEGLEVLYQEPYRVLLEVGPEKMLHKAAIAHPSNNDPDHRVLATMREPNEDESDLHQLLDTLSRLWLCGVKVNWQHYHDDKKRFRMPLPTYPFERKRHWIEKSKRQDYLPVLQPDELQKDVEPDMEAHYRPNVSTSYLAPRDEDERFISQVWCEFLGLKEVGINDDFFELGGSSLLALRLLALLSERFTIALASHVLLKKRTIASLAQFIKERAVSPEESNTPLIEIQRGHPRSTPLFLVHPLGGDVYFYREMAQELGSEQAVYAFQALSLMGKREPFSDLREQATDYVKELLKFKPPYLLGGSSYGGIVAFEMAQQLRKKGHKVPLVVLVDSPAPGGMPSKTNDFAEILVYLLGDELNINAEDMSDRTPEEQIAYVYGEAKIADRMDLLPATLGVPLFKTWMAHQEAMHSYQPKPYDGMVAFYRPTESVRINPLNMHLPWIDLVKGGIEIYQVPGNHLNMNVKPNVTRLAEHLKKMLRGVMSRGT